MDQVAIAQAASHARRLGESHICALHPGGVSDDPLCVYSLLWRLWERRAVEAEGQPLHLVPLFARADGSVVTSKDMDAYATQAFEALGLPPEDTGGAAGRIGGACDIRQAEGIERGKVLIQERGRWASDISWIYQRGDVGEQLLVSLDMVGASGASAETVIPGWAQPAYRALR